MPPFLIPLLGPLINLVGGAFGVDMSSDEAKVKLAQIQADAAKMISDQMNAQAEVNKAEASAPGRTWMTWREQLGYICTWAIGLNVVLQVIAAFATAMSYKLKMPVLDIQQLVVLLTGMLGLHVTDSVFNSPRGASPESKKAKPDGEEW